MKLMDRAMTAYNAAVALADPDAIDMVIARFQWPRSWSWAKPRAAALSCSCSGVRRNETVIGVIPLPTSR